MNVEFKWVKKDVSADGRYIRTVVFVDEQDVMPEEEFDGSDKYAENVVMYVEGKAVATGRIIVGNRGECLIGRIACLKEYRGNGYGTVIMKELIRRCKEKGFDTVYLHSQSRARGFYEKLGFKAFGDMYMEANILHISMKKSLY
jgi:acetyltransferase